MAAATVTLQLSARVLVSKKLQSWIKFGPLLRKIQCTWGVIAVRRPESAESGSHLSSHLILGR